MRHDEHGVTAAAATITIGGDLEVNRLGYCAMRLTGRGRLGAARRPRTGPGAIAPDGRPDC